MTESGRNETKLQSADNQQHKRNETKAPSVQQHISDRYSPHRGVQKLMDLPVVKRINREISDSVEKELEGMNQDLDLTPSRVERRYSTEEDSQNVRRPHFSKEQTQSIRPLLSDNDLRLTHLNKNERAYSSSSGRSNSFRGQESHYRGAYNQRYLI
jgi:hypothetical protein